MLFIAVALLCWALWFQLLSWACFQALAVHLTTCSAVLRTLGLRSAAGVLASLEAAWQQQKQSQPRRQQQQQPRPRLKCPPDQVLESRDSGWQQQYQRLQLEQAHDRASDSPAGPAAGGGGGHTGQEGPSTCSSTASLPQPAPSTASFEPSSLDAGCPRFSSTGSGGSSSEHASSISSCGACSAAASAAAGAAAAAAAWAVLGTRGLSKRGAAAVVAAAALASGQRVAAGCEGLCGFGSLPAPQHQPPPNLQLCAATSAQLHWGLPPVEFEVSEEELSHLTAAAPPELVCPLGRVLMLDPVFTPSGFTFHRPCIMAFIAAHGHDPVRPNPLHPSQLCPNINLRDQLVSWLKGQGVQT